VRLYLKASLAAVAAATSTTLINVIADMGNGAMYRILITTFYGLQMHCNSRVSNIYKEPTRCNLAVCLLITAIILYMFRTL